jgi:hypothetical protein
LCGKVADPEILHVNGRTLVLIDTDNGSDHHHHHHHHHGFQFLA